MPVPVTLRQPAILYDCCRIPYAKWYALSGTVTTCHLIAAGYHMPNDMILRSSGLRCFYHIMGQPAIWLLQDTICQMIDHLGRGFSMILACPPSMNLRSKTSWIQAAYHASQWNSWVECYDMATKIDTIDNLGWLMNTYGILKQSEEGGLGI